MSSSHARPARPRAVIALAAAQAAKEKIAIASAPPALPPAHVVRTARRDPSRAHVPRSVAAGELMLAADVRLRARGRSGRSPDFGSSLLHARRPRNPSRATSCDEAMQPIVAARFPLASPRAVRLRQPRRVASQRAAPPPPNRRRRRRSSRPGERRPPTRGSVGRRQATSSAATKHRQVSHRRYRLDDAPPRRIRRSKPTTDRAAWPLPPTSRALSLHHPTGAPVRVQPRCIGRAGTRELRSLSTSLRRRRYID